MKKIVLLAHVLVLLSTAVVIGFVKSAVAQGTIYIRANGLVEGTDKIVSVDNVTYTFTDNIFNQSIVVERDNLVVDGNGYTLQGTGSETGVDLTGYNRAALNVTVRNTNIKNFDTGIYCHGYMSYNSSISGNNITDNENGIWLNEFYDGSISGNNIINNWYGIVLGSYSRDNIVSGNNIANSSTGISVDGDDHTVTGNNIANSSTGISIGSDDNVVTGNNMANNSNYGIYLSRAHNNTISGNSITYSDEGIRLFSYSMYNIISENNVEYNNFGVYIEDSSNNTLFENDIEHNGAGVGLAWYSSDNVFYHNNFTDNEEQVAIFISAEERANVWDDGNQGNYWSDYTERYPEAEELNGSGIWNTPYVIDEYNQDNYPIIPEFPSWTSIFLILIMVTVAMAIYRRRLLKTSIQ